jgi:hypothetical protein
VKRDGVRLGGTPALASMVFGRSMCLVAFVALSYSTSAARVGGRSTVSIRRSAIESQARLRYSNVGPLRSFAAHPLRGTSPVSARNADASALSTVTSPQPNSNPIPSLNNLWCAAKENVVNNAGQGVLEGIFLATALDVVVFLVAYVVCYRLRYWAFAFAMIITPFVVGGVALKAELAKCGFNPPTTTTVPGLERAPNPRNPGGSA